MFCLDLTISRYCENIEKSGVFYRFHRQAIVGKEITLKKTKGPNT